MDNIIIIILGIILLLLLILNHVTIITNTNNTDKPSNCSKTTFGCCPDGINHKINYFGTNCPGYKPRHGHGYYPTPQPPGPGPMPPKPIGGCVGTRYGCCPHNQIPKHDQQGSNCLIN
jgi:hypothetical protein